MRHAKQARLQNHLPPRWISHPLGHLPAALDEGPRISDLGRRPVDAVARGAQEDRKNGPVLVATPTNPKKQPMKTNRRTVAVDTGRSETSKLTIGAPIWEASAMIDANLVRTGVYRMALYWLPRKRVLVARQYSIWDAGNGMVRGEHYVQVDPETFADDWAASNALAAAGAVAVTA